MARMPSCLERYLAGEHGAVWAELAALGAEARSPEHNESQERKVAPRLEVIGALTSQRSQF